MRKSINRILSILLVLCMAVSMVVIPVYAVPEGTVNLFEIDLNSLDSSGIFFKCKTNKDFASYEVGEEIIFNLSLFVGNDLVSVPYFHYTIDQDDGNDQEGYVDATTGTAQIRTTLTTPGVVVLKVWPSDENKVDVKKSAPYLDIYNKMKSAAQQSNGDAPLQAGAIAGASEISTALEEPADFDNFWAGQLADLNECAPDLVYLEEVTSSYSGFSAYVVKVKCIGNPAQVITNETWTAGVLTVPKNASAGTLKFKLSFQGYGVSSASQSATTGYVTFSVCAHSIEQLQSSSYYNDEVTRGLLGKGGSYGWSATENATPEGSYFRGMLLRDVQAVRFLQKYFGSEGGETSVTDAVSGSAINTGYWKGLWNGADIEVTGGSQGGFQAIAVSALVPDVTYCYASIPWFGNIGAQTVEGKVASGFLPPYAEGLAYYDTAYFAKRVKAVVAIAAGAGDTTSPTASVQAMFNNMNTDATLTFRQGQTHYQTLTYAFFSTQTKALTIAEGETYTLPFDVASLSEEGIISVNGREAKGVKGGVVTVNYTNGVQRKITVLSNAVGGDLNDDSVVDIRDAVLLAQYLAEWDVSINTGAADCNGDGAVDIRDAVLLAQYLAEWDVELSGGKPNAGGDKDTTYDKDIEIDFGDLDNN